MLMMLSSMKNMSMSEIKNLFEITFVISLIAFLICFVLEIVLNIFEYFIRKADSDIYNHKCFDLASERFGKLFFLDITIAIKAICFVLFDGLSASKTAVGIIESTYIVISLFSILNELSLYVRVTKSLIVDGMTLMDVLEANKKKKKG